MGQTQYLIYTNAVIDYLGNKLPATGSEFMNINVKLFTLSLIF